MARKSTNNRKGTSTDNYEVITSMFVDALQAVVDGTSERLPWQRDWQTLGVPRNGFSNRPYSGINVWLTCMSEHGQTDPRWATSNQIMQACGFERTKSGKARWEYKGEGEAPTERILTGNPTTIIAWRFVDTVKKDKDGNPVLDDHGNARKIRIPLLRTHRVYNFSQVNWPVGCEPAALTTDLDVDPAEVYAEAEALLNAYLKAQGITVKLGGDRAYYSITDDYVGLPKAKAFKSAEGYIKTKAHELVHSTGADSRLNRNLRGGFGTDNYAREELVAEFGAAFLCSDLGVSNEGELDDNHKAYLLSWIKRLQDNKYEVFTAARLAREAVALVKGEKAQAEEDDEADQAA